jgi:Zn-dependent peptidase ImmA (M78 family)
MQSRRQQLFREKIESLLAESHITQPIVDPEKIAARQNIIVRREKFDQDVSGFLLRQPGNPNTIIGINSSQPGKRQRFTLAHELGHFFLHGGQGYQEVHIDKAQFTVKMRDDASSKGEDREEIEANFFAAELLMPTQFLVRDIRRHGGFDVSHDDDTVAQLAKAYDVSVQAMSFRLSRLELLL